MPLSQQPCEQVVQQHRHCYLRHAALLSQLQSEAAPDGGEPPLLRRLRALGDDGGGSDGAAHSTGFVGAYLQEARRLRLFVRSSLEALWLGLLDGCGQLRGLGEELLQVLRVHLVGGAAAAHAGVAGRLAALRSGFDQTAQQLVGMEAFLRHNVAAAAQLAQMHDQPEWRCSGLELATVDGAYLAAAEAALLGELRLEPLVMGLSDAYELCRLLETDAATLAGHAAAWVPPDKFQRITRKFWLHPADVMRFKAAVIPHLPVLVFGDRRKLTEVSPHEVAFLADQASTTDGAMVSSVYYDNPASLPSYHVRLRKDDGASVVRLRWYGERDAANPEQRVFVERKVHRERYTGERSYKERAPIAQRHVAEYTAGTGSPPEMAQNGKHAPFLADAQRFLVEGGQGPMMRTVYRRTAFQESSDNMVRISLDTELRMLREEGAPRAPGDWCRDLGAPLPPGHAVYFPYAVVEIKLQQEPPAWVAGLLDMGVLLPVPKFSKFLHGTAMLYQPRCLNVPYWFLPDESDPRIMSPATWEEMADPADEFLQKGVDWLYPDRCRAAAADAQEEAAAAAAEGEEVRRPGERAVPYSPLRFLRRNKTVPVAIASSGGSSGTEAVAEAAVAGAAQPLQPAAPPQEQQQQHSRSTTWPVYANPLALLPPTDPSGNSLAHPLVPLPPGPAPPPAGAAATAALLRPASQTSQTSTPHDSAEDLEAGRSPGGAKAVRSGSRDGKRAPAAAAAAEGRQGGPPFSALQYRLPGAPPGGNGSRDGAQSAPTGRPRQVVRTKVEPKTFFANERTFLQWLQISVLIMMTATSLLSGTGLLSSLGGGSGKGGCDASNDRGCFASKLSGAIIAPVALLFMAYALFMYKKRTYQILNRTTARYDDQRGPVVLVVILLAVFLLAYILSMIWMF